MIHIPARLEKQLKDAIPRVRDREKFVANLIENALETHTMDFEDAPDEIGGTLHLFTDGGSRGNPGQAAIGCVLIDPVKGEVIREYKEAIGIKTNNVAEYEALIAGLKLASKYKPNRLICHLDSELVVKQLSGEYRIKMMSLQPLVDEIRELQSDFSDVQFVHVPRGDNFRADKLVNQALDERM